MLTLVLSIISTIVLSSILIPQIKSLGQTVKTQADKYYPSDLVITLNKGKLSTNRKEPIVIALPFDNGQNTKNLVIDPSASVSAMEKYRAGVLINNSSVSIAGENNEIRTYPLKDAGDFTLDKSQYAKITATVQKYLDILPTILPAILLFFLIFFFLIGLMVKILFYSLLTYMIARLQKFQITYGKALQLTIHAVTPIVFLQILETAFGIQIPIPFFFPILYIILLVIIVKELKNKPVVSKK